jgi:TPR repeat protein
LGTGYYNGSGVPQSYILAYMWLHIATANGANSAAALEIAAEQMTRDQITEARALARVCVSSGYQDCG